MKKTYIQPSMNLAYLATQQMIAFSFEDNDDHGKGGLHDEYAAEGDAMSKGRDDFGLW